MPAPAAPRPSLPPMKTKFALLASLLAASIASAAPLPQSAPVYVRPSNTAPVLTTLPAGAEPVSVSTGYGVLPTGWIAVTVKGPHEVFVQNKDLTKSLDVKPGAPLHREARAESAILATGAEGDQSEIIELLGRWTKLLLKKDLIGYIQVANATPPPTPAPAPAAPPTNAPAVPPPPAQSPVGQAVTSVAVAGDRALPRLFQGRLTSTRNPLRPRRPYDYQLTSEDGERYAYADLSKLLQTEQLDKYLDRVVVVYGAAHPVPGTQDIVVVVESLQLR